MPAGVHAEPARNAPGLMPDDDEGKENTMTKEETVDLSGTPLGGEEQAAVLGFCKALQGAPDVPLRSVSLYGSAARGDFRPNKSDINLLVVVKRIDVAILKCVVEPTAIGRRWGIAPFFITEKNLCASTDVFPVKFLAMQECYRVLVGHDVLGGLTIRREHLRLRCEQEFKNVLLRLRHHYIVRAGRDLTDLMGQMIGGVMETLRAAVCLTGEDTPPRRETAGAAAESFGVDAGVLDRVQDLRNRDSPLSKEEEEVLYDAFMATVEKVAHAVDQM